MPDKFSDVADAAYPERFEQALKTIDLINLDLDFIFSAGCIWTGFQFHARLLVVTLCPLGALLFLGITYYFARRKAGSLCAGGAAAEALRRVENAHISAVLWLTFFVYSTVSSTLFQAFACDDDFDGDVEYLRADYRIQCTSTKHQIFQGYSVLMMTVYTVGIPGWYWCLLNSRRSTLENKGLRKSEALPMERLAEWQRAQQVSDLWDSYRPECWYYEVCTGINSSR